MVRRLALTFFLVAFGFVSQSQAAIIYGGNTVPQNGAPPLSQGGTGVDGTVNFGVYYQDGTSGDSFGTGIAGFDSILSSAGIDTTGTYLYVYQLVNDGTNTVKIDGLQIQTWAPVDSLGYLAGYGLADDSGEVEAGDPFGTLAPPGDQDGLNLGVTGGYITAIGDGFFAGGTSVSFSAGSPGFLEATFNAGGALNTDLAAGMRTGLVVFTSAYGPARVVVDIEDGSTPTGTGLAPSTGTGNAPGVLPEPASMAIWSLGLAMVGGVGAWRRRRLKAAA